ncbi:MAG: choice-of-anchor D domain-containing protein [Terracidiphilus sp.]
MISLAFGSLAAMGQSASPALTSPAPGSVLPGSSVVFTWTADTNATQYKLRLGSEPDNSGNLGVYAAGRARGATDSVRATGLPTNGEIVYANLTFAISGVAYTLRYAYVAAYRGGSSPLPAIAALSCASASFTGSGTDTCRVTLTAAADKNGVNVELGSSNEEAAVPAWVKVPDGSKGTVFKANVAAVFKEQTAIFMATDGKSSRTFAVKLNAGRSVLELDSSSVAFGNVTLDSSSTQSIRMTSTGRDALIIDAVRLTGTGFALPGAKFPMTLNPGKSVALDVEFDPTAAGAITGALTVVSNSVTGSQAVVRLSGTGEKIGSVVRLSWDAPEDSRVSIAGFRVYRAIRGSSAYRLLNASIDAETSYVDETVQGGADYDYYVETVDSAGVSSAPSKVLAIAVP